MDGQISQHLGAHGGVGLDHLELFLGEPAGLVDDLVGDGDLADIVEGRGGAGQGDQLRGQVVPVGLFGQGLQEHLRDRGDVEHMQAALAVTEFHDVAQDRDHQVLGLLLLVDLVGHDVFQPPLLGVQQDGVVHTLTDDLRVEGTGQEIGYAQLVGPADDRGHRLRGDDDHGQIADPVVPVHVSQDTEAVQFRHHDVQQHQGEVLSAALQDGHGLQTVLGFHDVIILFQHIRQQHPVDRRVVHDQDLKAFRCSFHGKSPLCLIFCI